MNTSHFCTIAAALPAFVGLIFLPLQPAAAASRESHRRLPLRAVAAIAFSPGDDAPSFSVVLHLVNETQARLTLNQPRVKATLKRHKGSMFEVVNTALFRPMVVRKGSATPENAKPRTARDGMDYRLRPGDSLEVGIAIGVVDAPTPPDEPISGNFEVVKDGTYEVLLQDVSGEELAIVRFTVRHRNSVYREVWVIQNK